MVSPLTHRGYNKENECIVQKTGVDANTQINPQEVKTAIENVKKTFEEQLGVIANALMDLSKDAGDAVIVQGTNMTKTIEDMASLLKQYASQITNGIDQIYDYSVQAHDIIQQTNNNDAYNLCMIDGVVRID